jgi:muconolactone delta-isomerase
MVLPTHEVNLCRNLKQAIDESIKRKEPVSMRSMIMIQLDMQHREEIAALVPQEREYVSELMSKGTIEALYMSANRSSCWLVMRGESPEQIQQALSAFPLYPYMKPDFTPLAEPDTVVK